MKEQIMVLSAINQLGGYHSLAEKLGVSRWSIYKWAEGKQKVPIKHALKIEKLTKRKIKAKDLRPDVFG